MRGTGDVHGRRRDLWFAGLLVTLAAATALAVLTPRNRSEAAGAGAKGEPRTVSQAVTPDGSDGGDPGLSELKLDSGDELEIQASALPTGQPVLLGLGLPKSPAGSLAVRILADDGRILETTGVVHEDDPTRARVEIEAGWLNRPGRYIVELKTKERTHFPLRRYAIQLR